MIIFLHDAIGPMLMMLSCVKFLWCATRHFTFKSRQPAIQPMPIDITMGVVMPVGQRFELIHAGYKTTPVELL